MNLRFRLDIHWSSVRSSSSPPGELPAQVTRMSIFPNRASVASTHRCTSAVTLMSPAMGTTSRPVAAQISLAAFCSGSALRAVITTSAPSRARSSATARPMPLLAPVTKATLPPSCRSNANPSHRLTVSPVPSTTRPPPAFRTHGHTQANRHTHLSNDGWYIKYQARNRGLSVGRGGVRPAPAGLAHGRRRPAFAGPRRVVLALGAGHAYARVRPNGHREKELIPC